MLVCSCFYKLFCDSKTCNKSRTSRIIVKCRRIYRAKIALYNTSTSRCEVIRCNCCKHYKVNILRCKSCIFNSTLSGDCCHIRCIFVVGRNMSFLYACTSCYPFVVCINNAFHIRIVIYLFRNISAYTCYLCINHYSFPPYSLYY